MTLRRTYAPWLIMLFVLSACSSTEVSDRRYNTREQLPPPNRILVYNFTANPADVPPQSSFATSGAIAHDAPTAQELEMTHELGAEVARLVTHELQDAGLPAVYAAGQAPLEVNDVAIRGYFVSVDEGSSVKRVLIGFSSGNTSLTTAVEGYQMTAQGLRLLGSATVSDNGNSAPGAALPLAVMAATANPIGLAVNGTFHLVGEVSGSSTIEGAAARTADLVSEQLIEAAERQGWL
jgi:hypothetical protein